MTIRADQVTHIFNVKEREAGKEWKHRKQGSQFKRTRKVSACMSDHFIWFNKQLSMSHLKFVCISIEILFV